MALPDPGLVLQATDVQRCSKMRDAHSGAVVQWCALQRE